MKERNMNEILKPIFTACCLVGICTSCVRQEEEVYTPSEGEVSFISSIHASSRATATTFETDDAISVFAFTGSGTSGFASESYATNKKYIYRNTRFVASGKENAIVYPTSDEALSFQAIYPYGESAGSSFVFNVREDQSQGLNYTLSDLMTASVAATTEASPSLRFSHRLSNIVFTLSFDVAPAGTTQVTFQNVRKAASVDMLTGTFAGTGESGNVKAAVSGTNSYKAVLPPQTVEAGAAIAVITTEAGDTYTWKMPKGTVWKSGIQYAYTLTIDKQGEVTFTSEINPWEEEATEESRYGGKLVVRPQGGSENSTFMFENIIYDENDWSGDANSGIVLDTILACEMYDSKNKNDFWLQVNRYRPGQAQYQMSEFSVEHYLSEDQNKSIEFRQGMDDFPGNITAEISEQNMDITLNVSGNGTLRTSAATTTLSDIISGNFVLPLAYKGITKKNVQQMSDINFPNFSFELPFPVDEAVVITESKVLTKGGALFYLEGGLALYEEMKQKIEASGFMLEEESTGTDSKEGTWIKDNKMINVDYSPSGIGIVLKDDILYDFCITAIEMSSTNTRSTSNASQKNKTNRLFKKKVSLKMK